MTRRRELLIVGAVVVGVFVIVFLLIAGLYSNHQDEQEMIQLLRAMCRGAHLVGC